MNLLGKEVTGTYDPDKFNKPKPKKSNKAKSSKRQARQTCQLTTTLTTKRNL